MSNQLTILNNSIRSFDNLYSLKDLHKISGGEKKHEPYLFIRLETTQELITEIKRESDYEPVKTIRGTQGGTYACEELVIAYAMWISPKFHLIVLRAFLAMHKAESQNASQIQPLALPMINDDFKQAMIKILNYASQYEVFQRAICTKRGEAQQRQMEFFFSEISDKESYLFVFKPNIAQDIQQASDLLHKLITQ
ncbi:MAG: KilA-N domain-containing protein [Haemophilus influenzae]|nr:KilA-N domain-containing protein [Haemophilus influenzae]